MFRKQLVWMVAAVLATTLQACGNGGGGGNSAATGLATVSLTDAPGDFDHVWITVKDIWFHTNDAAGPGDGGWLKYPLDAPKTVDLLTLSKGAVGAPVWGNINLPVGTYQQIRILLAPTFEANPPDGHSYYNEVVIGANAYPLRVPDAEHGIRLNGTFQITENGTLRLAVDFDANHDVVDIQRNGVTEYLLKPRLAYFDLDHAGAIVGHIDLSSAGTNSTSHFVVKAEQVNDPQNPQYHVVRRTTVVDPVTGKYIFYPLKPGAYDIVIRGIGYQTVIVKGVPVASGTTPAAEATVVPEITMTASSGDYAVDGAIPSPFGAWVNFYQTLQGPGEVPYEIRFRHFNPLTGKFIGFKLSSDQVQLASYVSGTLISGPTGTDPVEGAGKFSAVADAVLYDRSASQIVSSATVTVSFGDLTPTAPAVSRSVSGLITVPSGSMGMNRGILFAVHDGMIVNAIPIDGQMSSGGAYTMNNLPGGSPATPLRGAFYGIEAMGWSSVSPAVKALSLPGIADLRTGNDAGIDMHMIMLP